MAQSESTEPDEPVRRSGVGTFFLGALLGAVACLLVVFGLTLSFPLPEDLPGVGTVRVEGSGVTGATGGDADQDQDSAATQSGTDTSANARDGDGGDVAADPQGSDATASGDQQSATASNETPTAGQADDPATDASDAGDQNTDSDAVAESSGAEPAGDKPELPAGEINLAGPALEVNARTFEAPAGAPLLAVVLVDAGNGTIEPDALSLLTMPLTLAIEPVGPESTELAAAARTAKHEVLVQMPFARSDAETEAGFLNSGMSADEITDLTTRNLAALPGALGIMPRDGAQMLNDREAMQVVVAPLKQHGFAFVGLTSGGGASAGLAEEAGVPYAAANRQVPPEANGDQIFTNLENAAFQARQKGTAIVQITASREALTSLLRWGLEKDRRPVWFAPVSAVIARRAGAG